MKDHTTHVFLFGWPPVTSIFQHMTQFYLSLWLNRTPVCINCISFIHSFANGYTVWLPMWPLWTVLQTTLCVSISWGPSHWSLSGTYLQVVYIAGHKNFHTDFHSGQQFTFLQQCVWVPFPTSLQAFVTASPWQLRILNTFSGICWWYVRTSSEACQFITPSIDWVVWFLIF